MCTKFVDAISTSYCIRTTSIGKTSPSDLIEQNRLFLVMVMVNTKYLMKAIMTHSMHCLFYKVPKDISRLFFAYEQIHSRTPKWIVDTSIAKRTKLSLRSHLTHIFTHHQHYRECETVSLAPPCDPG